MEELWASRNVYAEIEDTRIYYEVSGRGDAVVFLHGFSATGQMWSGAVRRRAPGFRYVVPDLRGHGRSDVSETVSVERLSDDVAGLLDVLECQRAVFCGLSMGGVIALEMFCRHRARVTALVLCDCTPAPENEKARQEREQLAQAVLREGSRFAAEAIVDRVLAPQIDSSIRRYWHGIISSNSPVGLAAAARALAHRRDYRPLLPHVDVPTLVVFGALDARTPPQIGREMAAAIPGARLELIEAAGHAPPIERPGRFASVLNAFLESLSSSAADGAESR